MIPNKVIAHEVIIYDDVKELIKVEVKEKEKISNIKNKIMSKFILDGKNVRLFSNGIELKNNDIIKKDIKINLKIDQYKNLEKLYSIEDVENISQIVLDNNSNTYVIADNTKVYKNGKLIVDNLSDNFLNKIYVHGEVLYIINENEISKYNLNGDYIGKEFAEDIHNGCKIVDFLISYDDEKVYLVHNDGYKIKNNNYTLDIDAENVIGLEYNYVDNHIYYVTRTAIYKLSDDFKSSNKITKAKYSISYATIQGRNILINENGKMFTKDNKQILLKYENNSYKEPVVLDIAANKEGVYIIDNKNKCISTIPSFSKSKSITKDNVSVVADMLSTTKLNVQDLEYEKNNSNIIAYKQIDMYRNENMYTRLENITLIFENLKNIDKVKIIGDNLEKIVPVINEKAMIDIDKLGVYKVEKVEENVEKNVDVLFIPLMGVVSIIAIAIADILDKVRIKRKF